MLRREGARGEFKEQGFEGCISIEPNTEVSFDELTEFAAEHGARIVLDNDQLGEIFFLVHPTWLDEQMRLDAGQIQALLDLHQMVEEPEKDRSIIMIKEEEDLSTIMELLAEIMREEKDYTRILDHATKVLGAVKVSRVVAVAGA